MKHITLKTILSGLLLLVSPLLCVATLDEITPDKFIDVARGMALPIRTPYTVPASSRFTAKRPELGAPDIVYYVSTPQRVNTYPIAIICGGSSNRKHIESIIHLHRYFLKECTDIGAGVVTVEQWGVDGTKIHAEEFMKHYTRSQRLNDHNVVIRHLQAHPPIGWNGMFIFIGISEGGTIATTLTQDNTPLTLATLNLSGAGDWGWREELWLFIEAMKQNAQWWRKALDYMPRWMPFEPQLPKNRYDYDRYMDKTIANPTPDKEFMAMTYRYHADALQYQKIDYQKLSVPFLVLAGAQDPVIQSTDEFVQKAAMNGVLITYMRIPEANHYVYYKIDIIQEAFRWLEEQIITE
jgi:pimeloyl-ACP methyl ester carboxylesterase